MFSDIDSDYSANHTGDRAEHAIVEQRQPEHEIIIERGKYYE